MLVTLTLLAAVSLPNDPNVAELQSLRPENVSPEILRDLREAPQATFICPKGNAESFRKYNRKSINALLGKPDLITHDNEPGERPNIGWHYFLHEGRKPEVSPGRPFAEYIFWLGPGGKLNAVGCFSKLNNASFGWSHLLVRPTVLD